MLVFISFFLDHDTSSRRLTGQVDAALIFHNNLVKRRGIVYRRITQSLLFEPIRVDDHKVLMVFCDRMGTPSVGRAGRKPSSTLIAVGADGVVKSSISLSSIKVLSDATEP